VQVVLVNVDGEPYAFKNACAMDGMPLEGARLADTVLVCPWHNCAYDARTGKREDDASQPGLAVVPVAVADGAVQVAVNVL
jgi:nitrite reductase/ring-hydroxylating ferredoxin subunit